MGERIKLVAPAGNKAAFIGNIYAGADDIYTGGPRFSARANAENLTQEELIKCIHFGHLCGCRTFLAINTLIRDDELPELVDYLLPYYENGLDGVIVQDLGVMRMLVDLFPELEIIISTQTGITGNNGALLMKKLGAVQVVPARECSLKELVSIKQKSGLPVECFVHGSMCYCYSGQCLMSSMLGGRSGNRGRCAGPCRLLYTYEGKQEYALNMKDLCTLELLPELVDADLDAMKIEGRMKKPEYAAGTCAVYCKYTDLCYGYDQETDLYTDRDYAVEEKDLRTIEQLYVRGGLMDGYFHRYNGREMLSLEEGGYLGCDPGVLEKIAEKYLLPEERLPIVSELSMYAGEPVKLTMTCSLATIRVVGEKAQKAKTEGMSAEMIKEKLNRLGDTLFQEGATLVSTDGKSFYPVGKLNELRRTAVERLLVELVETIGFEGEREADPAALHKILDEICVLPEIKRRDIVIGCKVAPDRNKDGKRGFSVLFTTREQLEAFLGCRPEVRWQFERVILESHLLLELKGSKLLKEIAELRKTGQFILLAALPMVSRECFSAELSKYEEWLKKSVVDALLVRNLEQLGYLKDRAHRGGIYCDANIYVWNRLSFATIWDWGVKGFTYPYELSRKQERALFEDNSLEIVGEKIVYGRQPLMVSANCLFKTHQECKGRGVHYTELKDRKDVVFPVKADCRNCQNVIYNSVPTSLHKDLYKRYNKTLKRLSFTTETAQETREIVHYFGQLSEREDALPPYQSYTTAYDKDGVL